MSVLAVRGLEICAGDFPVLRGLDLDLAPGRALGLVGESGAGKSLLASAIAGMLPRGFRATSGRVDFLGRDLIALAPDARRALLGRQIAFIPRDPATALDPLRTIGAQMGERRAAAAALEAAGVREPETVLGQYPHRISVGARQSVLIAMAFASAPKLIVADEPTAMLDFAAQAQTMETLAYLHRAHGTAMLFITQDLRLAAETCDEIAVLYAGSVVERGPARDVIARPAHPYPRCLELASPPSAGPPRALYSLPDRMPGVRTIAGMSGCRFEPRCPLAVLECRQGEPRLREVADGRWAACLRAGEAGSIEPVAKARWVRRASAGKGLLSVDGATKRFASGSLFWGRANVAVRSASFAIARGEFVGLIGESGSGKTTLGKMIAGVARPDGGRIMIDGIDVTDLRPEARAHRIVAVRMVAVDVRGALNPRRRVSEIVTQAMEAAGQDMRTREKSARDLIRLMDLPADALNRIPDQLSIAECVRVNISRALCGAPRLLVLDGVDAGLDVSARAHLLTLLQRLRGERDVALLFISHDLVAVRHLCDRVLAMRRGEIVEDFAISANPMAD